ncbi:MAG: hypothetical protein QNJ43_26190, partial [Breoghania sp.]|nr:hypothetical protein [Breoghania sp.]
MGLVLCLGIVSGGMMASAQDGASKSSDSTADHTQFKILQQPFESGEEVTKACLRCHTEATKQVKDSIHWKWEYDHPKTGQKLGKWNVINAFCGNVASNEPRCTSCHAGYGWDKMSERPRRESAVNCLVCHADKSIYAKLDNQAGRPAVAPFKEGAKTITGKKAVPIDFAKATQSVGMPGRENCGQCHFYSGGDNVKHGDLSSALVHPDRSVNVHMSKDGGNFSCSTCRRRRAADALWRIRCGLGRPRYPDDGAGGISGLCARNRKADCN